MRPIDRKPSDKNTYQAINRLQQQIDAIEKKEIINNTIVEILPTPFPGEEDTPTNTPTSGQLYVKNSDGDLYYKNLKGVEWKVNNQRWERSSSFFHAFGNNSSEMIPLAGGSITTTDKPADDFDIDDSYYVVPYDLKVTSLKGLFSKQQALNPNPGDTTITLYKNGTALSNAVTVNVSSVGYDQTNLFQNIYTWDLSKETNTYKAGDVMGIEIDPTNFIYYASLTAIGEYI